MIHHGTSVSTQSSSEYLVSVVLTRSRTAFGFTFPLQCQGISYQRTVMRLAYCRHLLAFTVQLATTVAFHSAKLACIHSSFIPMSSDKPSNVPLHLAQTQNLDPDPICVPCSALDPSALLSQDEILVELKTLPMWKLRERESVVAKTELDSTPSTNVAQNQ